MSFTLIAETTDPDFFKENVHDLGVTVYTQDGNNHVKEVVYFSGSRVIRLTENIPEVLADFVRKVGTRFNVIEIDSIMHTVELR